MMFIFVAPLWKFQGGPIKDRSRSWRAWSANNPTMRAEGRTKPEALGRLILALHDQGKLTDLLTYGNGEIRILDLSETEASGNESRESGKA